jgi:hypothetical protein
MAEEQEIPLGERTIFVTTRDGQVPVTVYRTSDKQDWMTTHMSHLYMSCTPYVRDMKIKQWEAEGKLKRSKIKGKALYIRLVDLNWMRDEIHSAKEVPTEEN